MIRICVLSNLHKIHYIPGEFIQQLRRTVFQTFRTWIRKLRFESSVNSGDSEADIHTGGAHRGLRVV